jgi:Ca2+:H+ antiporter
MLSQGDPCFDLGGALWWSSPARIFIIFRGFRTVRSATSSGVHGRFDKRIHIAEYWMWILTRFASLGVAWITVTLFILFGGTWLREPISNTVAAVLFVWLFATMVWSAFGAIKVADSLAEILGEPLGSLVLTLTIICLEGVLIGIAILTSESGGTMGRDTLFGANMIMINFTGGLALFLGGLRHREQTYNFQGTSAFLAVVITLSVLGFILPSYTKTTPAGSLTNVQSIGIIVVTVFIYITFLLIQIGRHSHFFVEPELAESAQAPIGNGDQTPKPEPGSIGKLALVLVLGVVPILLMGKYLTTLLDFASERLGAPPALGGVILALIVVSPKMISAIKAGLANQPQRAVNLALGSCAPAMGVILPIILGIGIVTGKTVILGAEPSDMILLALTLVLSALTFSGTHTTLLEGVAHLAVFVMYVVLMFSP